MAHTTKTAPALRLALPADYAEFPGSLNARVQHAQTKAMLLVNRELIAIYWNRSADRYHCNKRLNCLLPKRLDGKSEVHVRPEFNCDGSGPITLDAGRHCGFGLFAAELAKC